LRAFFSASLQNDLPNLLMRFLFRRFWLPFYRLWALRHVRRECVFRYVGLQLAVPPGVFHPGVFFSTPIFISFLQKIDFQEKTVLDVGAGSGLLALFAAQHGAVVTALDINPLAVKTAHRNAELNALPLTAVESDLFDNLPLQLFDIILINPPYYPRAPLSAAEHAFFAGENWEYFEKLFRKLPGYIHSGALVWMILSEDCDVEKITAIAAAHSFRLTVVFEKKKWGEQFFVVKAEFEGHHFWH
jgi:release factor glutamine methyltransferase